MVDSGDRDRSHRRPEARQRHTQRSIGRVFVVPGGEQPVGWHRNVGRHGESTRQRKLSSRERQDDAFDQQLGMAQHTTLDRRHRCDSSRG
jgi:alkylated DNA nucleotide flippase Atl1